MIEKHISKISLIINSILFIGIGFTIIFLSNNLFLFIIATLITLVGLFSLISNLINTKKLSNIFISSTTLLTGVMLIIRPNYIIFFFPAIVSIYIFINGVIKLLSYIIYKKNKITGISGLLVGGMIDFVFCFIMMTNSNKNIHWLIIFLGVYFICFGISYLYDFLKELNPNKFDLKKRRFRMTLPIFISAFIPYKVYTKINNLLDKYTTDVTVKNKAINSNVDLEIFIHVKNSAIGVFGHADFCFDNVIYSYGSHDEDNRYLFDTRGCGVLFKVNNREEYLKFCTHHSKRTVFSFGISLNDIQKLKLKEELQKIEKNAYRWYCAQERDKSNDYNDYASRLYKNTKAKFYKFKKGKYKSYFLLSMNCMKIVDDIVGAIGGDMMKINGIITPGAYYNYLNREFKRKNSFVITKKIYNIKRVKNN